MRTPRQLAVFRPLAQSNRFEGRCELDKLHQQKYASQLAVFALCPISHPDSANGMN